jgi:antitoxin component YwqK of YwqJK toxin-antitoxin module
MKPFLIILISLTFTLTAIGQQQAYPDSGFTNKAEAKNLTVNGKKEGKWLEYLEEERVEDTVEAVSEWDTSHFYIRHTYISDKFTQDTNATFYRLTIYKEGVQFGIMRQYYRSGKLNWEINYSPYEERIYDENGKLMSSTANQNKSNVGMAKEYYENGKVRVPTPLIRQKGNGVAKGYYESGKLMEETPYINGLINGVEKDYYENGNIQSETPYRNDTISGVQKYYYKNGKIWRKVDVIDNTYQGSISVYDSKGRVMVYQTTRNDTLLSEVDSGHGLYTRIIWYWSRATDKNLDKISESNRDYFYKFWDGYGYAASVNGTRTVYYKSGQIKKVISKTDDKKNGDCKWYDKKGKLTKIITYNMGVITSKESGSEIKQ